MKLTEETKARIYSELSLGATREMASSAANIGTSTFYNWMNRGEEENTGIYRDFLDTVKRAEAVCVGKCLRTIKAAMHNGQWQAAAWMLERRYPMDYGRNRTGLEDNGGTAKNDADAGPRTMDAETLVEIKTKLGLE